MDVSLFLQTGSETLASKETERTSPGSQLPLNHLSVDQTCHVLPK